jgi:hypothetical protein
MRKCLQSAIAPAGTLFPELWMTFSNRQSMLLRILARLDQQIARVEAILLAPLSGDFAHRTVDQLATLESMRLEIESKLQDEVVA